MNARIPETTVGAIHEAMRAGDLTSRELVERYTTRIDRYDRTGPELNGVVTVNSAATARAAELDERLAREGLIGPLHGIPILVKDQALTAGLRTTFGSEAFDDYVPETDATVVSKLRDAGAIILGKTNLPDWAAGDAGVSSVQGRTKNPYALDRDPGGSSAGTGAAVAANLCTVGIGEDTGGSIRVPASCCNLFGIRVTTGLISRAGFSPLVPRQDTPGPMARTVADLARVLDVLVGYDPQDRATSVTQIAGGGSYLDAVETGDLDGVRLGVVRQAFGDDERSAPVTAVVEDAMATLSAAGAELVDAVSIPELDARLDETWLYGVRSRAALDDFLDGLEGAPVDGYGDLYERGLYNEGQELLDVIAEGPAEPTARLDYWRKVAAQTDLRQAILAVHSEHDLDALVFPDVKIVPRPAERIGAGARASSAETYMTNTYIASQSSCPAVSMPGGFTDDGLPVGVELVAPPYRERRLLAIAAAYESVAETRAPPSTAPAL
ncbi:amidase [Haloplanus ruber]|uniref:Amidase n=1 Tax=Haloplanus ruber TaxID=869892 RepID=A0ABD6CSZ8_9EURY|nr:amidase [Haloplanus ruber]